MRIRFLATLLVFSAVPAWSAETSPPAAPHTFEVQQRLAVLAGEWQVEQSLWTQPGAAPAFDRGRATLALVLGGRYLEQRLHVASATPFEGWGFVGFDAAAAQFFATWMDTDFGGLLLLHGNYEPTQAAYVLRGEMAMPGQRIPVREVLRIENAEHFTIDYFETRDGKEMRMVGLDYRRM